MPVTAESSEESVEKELTGEIANVKDGENETIQVPGTSQISGEGKLANNISRRSAATVSSPREIDSRRPTTRSRTRSLSSAAVSSISGEHSSVQSGGGSAEDGRNIDPIMFDYGKTPRRTNSFSSRGPMRKRHKQNTTAPRSLFRTTNESRSVPSDGLPLKFSSTSVTFSKTRERSNTIDSFRAAMDHQANDYDLHAETVALPKMKVSEQHEGEIGTFFYESQNLLPSPRSRSDTIDFLTAADFDSGSAIYADDMRTIPDDEINDVSCDNQINASKMEEIAPKCHERVEMTELTEQRKEITMGVACGKTPKIANRSRDMSQSSESPSQGPLRKRYRTRSLSFALSLEGKAPYKTSKNLDKNDQRDVSTKDFPIANEDYEDDDATELGGCTGRKRSGTFDLLNDEIFHEKRRQRSDTMDFLTAAIAGDMGHDLDAAVAATADDGASFMMHHVSAPSGASLKYNPRPPKRLRSDTLDSTASSINSAKLDFFVSVAAEQGALTSPIYSGEGVGQKRSGSLANHEATPWKFTRICQPRERGVTLLTFCGGNDDSVGNFDDGNVLDHLNSLCDEPKVCDPKTTRQSRLQFRFSSDMDYGLVSPRAKMEETSATRNMRKNSETTWKTNLSQDSINNQGRNRLESWGGMSDLSAGGIGALAATHSALKDTGIMDDVLAAAADLGFDDISDGASSLERLRKSRTASGGSNSSSGHAKIQKERPRFNSITSLSIASLSDSSISMAGRKDKDSKLSAKKASKDVNAQPTKPSDTASVSTRSIFVDYDAIASAVHAANAATEGLDLTSILGTPSTSMSPKAIVDSTAQSNKSVLNMDHSSLGQKPSEISATTLQKVTISQPAMKPSSSAENAQQSLHEIQPKPPLITSMPAMTAAPQLVKATPDTIISGLHMNAKSPAPFPVTTINIPFVPIPESTKTKEEMDAIRERARAAAGYVPPGEEGTVTAKKPPPRPMKTHSSPFQFNSNLHPSYHPGVSSHTPFKKRGLPPYTPSGLRPDLIQSNIAHTPYACTKPVQTPSSALSSKSGTLQSQQKWDDMFECLVKFIEETREKATRHMNEKQKAAWVWDGNVPTSHKTKCGKALGRWINNQRSAKAKDALKDDREVRLVSTGLKWSVLTTNSWRQMLHELEIYVREQTKDGRPWDGNVPTNYKIKTNLDDTCPEDEEKNLGRWVNRQRSLFQAGKLKKDRQEDLEKIGLKWSVLLTTSWTTMYECLRSYAEEKQKQSPHGWDGNVQANFKTRTNPPLSLGRWVNRQRVSSLRTSLPRSHR
ncbi:hypothetical protein ACHAXA_010918 [Cyclostephanos tholiformis]|uniref:Helicase-associated domain-containing protein n=1 Tax=Cyclostephanos tholiformis TaxID=382380 RepID=A0ABD3R867_9STRA